MADRIGIVVHVHRHSVVVAFETSGDVFEGAYMRKDFDGNELPSLGDRARPWEEVTWASRDSSQLWSCYTCDHLGDVAYLDTDVAYLNTDVACCPECGTVEGDGFGMAENDPRVQEPQADREVEHAK